MRHSIMRRFTILSLAVALAAWLGAMAIAILSWSGIQSQPMTVVATTTMIATLGLQLAFLLAQLLPEGRALIKLRYCGPDAWLTILCFTLVPGVVWHILGEVAAPFMLGIMPGLFTPLLTAVLFMLARLIQQGNYRHLVGAAQPPAM